MRWLSDPKHVSCCRPAGLASPSGANVAWVGESASTVNVVPLRSDRGAPPFGGSATNSVPTARAAVTCNLRLRESRRIPASGPTAADAWRSGWEGGRAFRVVLTRSPATARLRLKPRRTQTTTSLGYQTRRLTSSTGARGDPLRTPRGASNLSHSSADNHGTTSSAVFSAGRSNLRRTSGDRPDVPSVRGHR